MARLNAEPEWRRGRTRDLIAAREVIIELQAKFERALIARGTDGRMLFLANEAARAAFDAMPSQAPTNAQVDSRQVASVDHNEREPGTTWTQRRSGPNSGDTTASWFSLRPATLRT